MSLIEQASERARYETPLDTMIQRREALDKANDIRLYRAALKRRVKDSRESVHDLLLDPPEKLETMQIIDLLLATPQRGRTKVNQLLMRCRISPSKTIGGLSHRQRTELVSMLRR